MTETVVPLRRWVKTQDGFELREGRQAVGYVLTTEYGTICFGGPLGRGTSESVDGAKSCVEQMFDPDSAYSQMMNRASEQLSER